MDKAIIIGAGTYGQVYAEYLKDLKKYEIQGFLDDDQSKQDIQVNGIKVLGVVNKLADIQEREKISIFVPIGNNIVRERILQLARSLSYQTPSFIHPSSCVHHTVSIGNSVYVLPSTSIMPHTKIEDNVMISMGVNIAHHTTLGTGCFLSQGVNVGASIEIGENTFIGIGSTIMTGVKFIGKNAIIGAGSVVIREVPDGVTVVGNPGRVIKINNP